jgi:cell division FtsZ-interacting protein ZapD
VWSKKEQSKQIHKDLSNLLELRDAKDELKIIQRILERQQTVIEAMKQCPGVDQEMQNIMARLKSYDHVVKRILDNVQDTTDAVKTYQLVL